MFKDADDTCSQCQPVAPQGGRLKRTGAWIGLLLFCPCHLPLTIAGLLLMLSAWGLPASEPWMRPVLYAVFGGSFTFFVVVLVRWAMRRRDLERAREAQHEAHSPSLATPHVVSSAPPPRPVSDDA